MTFTWNAPVRTLMCKPQIICMLCKMFFALLFQVRLNWLTWNMDRPQRPIKQGLVFQVNVRNANINGVIDYANDATEKKWPFCSRCARDCFYAQTLRQWRSTSALESPEKGGDCATHWIFIRVAQLMWLGVRYNGDRVRHRLGFPAQVGHRFEESGAGYMLNTRKQKSQRKNSIGFLS